MKTILLLLNLFIFSTFFAQNTVIGKWKTIDDKTGKPKSIIEIYEKDGKIYGKIIDILNPANKKNLCTACTGAEKNKPIMGMILINGLTKDDNEYNGGTILDPTNGKIYKCYIELESQDKLKVRGYIGLSIIGRTQYWFRIKN
jgi:uncharacterized protein (DUF2147 family)